MRLKFTDDAVDGVAREALKRGTGARGLRAILEDVMLDVMYELPSIPGLTECIITREVIMGTERPVLVSEREGGERLSGPAALAAPAVPEPALGDDSPRRRRRRRCRRGRCSSSRPRSATSRTSPSAPSASCGRSALIAAEDTRRTRTLLAGTASRRPPSSYFEHNKPRRGPELVARLQAGARWRWSPTPAPRASPIPASSWCAWPATRGAGGADPGAVGRRRRALGGRRARRPLRVRGVPPRAAGPAPGPAAGAPGARPAGRPLREPPSSGRHPGGGGGGLRRPSRSWWPGS